MSVPVVVDTAAARCLPADPRARREFSLTVQAPQPDVTGAEGRRYVSDRALQAKIDEMRAAIRRKNAVGLRALDEQDRCATRSPATS